MKLHNIFVFASFSAALVFSSNAAAFSFDVSALFTQEFYLESGTGKGKKPLSLRSGTGKGKKPVSLRSGTGKGKKPS